MHLVVEDCLLLGVQGYVVAVGLVVGGTNRIYRMGRIGLIGGGGCVVLGMALGRAVSPHPSPLPRGRGDFLWGRSVALNSWMDFLGLAFHPHPNLPPSRGKGFILPLPALPHWVPACAGTTIENGLAFFLLAEFLGLGFVVFVVVGVVVVCFNGEAG